ncbi:MAG: transposase family protein [Candidatus Neomarinimicrobiota bacterium]
MGGESRREYLAAIRLRYHQASKQEKTVILNEFCSVCEYHRKHALRLLNQKEKKPKKRPGRKPVYDAPELLTALKRIWLATDQMCSKKLAAAIPLWLPYYEKHYGKLTDDIKGKLLAISAATIDRHLSPIRVTIGPKGLGGTKPGRLLRSQIPIRTHNWDITQPGFMEADTVAHCGNSLAGDFIWSLTLTDIHTGWTECRATWNNGATGVLEQIKDIQQHLAFPLKGFDCDNGSEFLNYHLLRYFTDHTPKISFTRSRPYRKNDNPHVEQKNWSCVRHLLGYDRLDNPGLVEPINTLYATLWSLWYNHFCPTLKLIEKKRINSRYYKKYDNPKTPFQRLLESPSLSHEQKETLKKRQQILDPFNLKRQIDKQLKAIFKLVSVTSNVRKRL